MFPVILIFALSILTTSVINYMNLQSTVEKKTKAYLEIFTDNILLEIRHLNNILEITKQALDEKHVMIARTLANWRTEDISFEELKHLAYLLDAIEINIVSPNGIITGSTDIDLIGFNYKEHILTSKYIGLINGTLTEIMEEPRESILPNGLSGGMNHYAGVPLSGGRGFIQIGFNVNVFTMLREEINIEKTIAEQKIGRGGFGMVLSKGEVIAAGRELSAFRVTVEEDWYKTVTSGDGFAWIVIDNERYFAGYKSTFQGASYNHTVVGLVPEGEYYSELNRLLIQTALFMLATIIIIVISLYMVLGNLLSPVKHLVASLDKIAEGDFNTRIEHDYNDEFNKIKDAINSMVDNIIANKELAIINERLKSLSNTDELTKLNNRRSFIDYMDVIWKQNHRLKLPVTVMLIDIDYFKKYNDSLGHLEGDKALVAVAQYLKEQIKRETDFVARFGGEEFIYILPFVNRNEAVEFSKTLVMNVEKMAIPHPMSEISKYITISAGVETVIPDNNNSIKQLLDNADKALYAAKQYGRNRAVIYENDEIKQN